MSTHHVNIRIHTFDCLQHPLELPKGQKGRDVWEPHPDSDGFSFEYLETFVVEHRAGGVSQPASRERDVTPGDALELLETILAHHSLGYSRLQPSQLIEVELRRAKDGEHFGTFTGNFAEKLLILSA